MSNRIGQINEEKRKGPDIMGMTLTTRAMQENPASEGIYMVSMHIYCQHSMYNVSALFVNAASRHMHPNQV